ncbi:MAG TPA: FAD-dependent oxidoreductase, partial [Acetobacteraceae bacterium]|nr:FAD-dependent oxidoreductase [Acetobacteraceae bacterium]
AARRNPLVRLAPDRSALVNADRTRTERVFVNGRPATSYEQAAYDRVWDRLEQVVAPALAGPDRTLAEAMHPMQNDPWSGMVALWEGAIIAGADADVLGLQDWHRNGLEGPNLLPQEGVGGLVQRLLAQPVELGTRVTRLDWGGQGVVAETNRGTLRAAAAIVTVSTGVLASGAIRFDPELPASVQAAVRALPMGLLTKIALAGPGPGGLGIEQDGMLVDRDGRMTFNAWPQGRPYISGFVGGRLAWSVAEDPVAAEALARAELARMLGGAAGLGGGAVVTRWGTDPLHLGAYAYAGPGDADQRGVLAMAFPGERLLFAGEACRMDGLAGTVGGAFLSGEEAADRLIS